MIHQQDIQKDIASWVASTGFEQPLLIISHSQKLQEELGLFAMQCAVCTEQQEAPCGVCNACKQAKAHAHPDAIVVSGEDNRIRVKDIATLRATLANTSNKRVVCIPFAQHLLPQAANALLKTLEEPSKNTRFLLGAKSVRSILPTIKSRCKVVMVNSLASEEAPFNTQEVLKKVSDLRKAEPFQESDLLEISRLVHQMTLEQGASPELFKVSQRLRDYYKTASFPGGNTKLAADILLASLAVLRNTGK